MKAQVHKCEWVNKRAGVAQVNTYSMEIPAENRLDFLQNLVGGLIDIYNYKGNDLIVNDEGLLLELPMNIWASDRGLQIAGTIVEIEGVLT